MPLTTEQLDAVHLTATTLVNDFVVMEGVFCGLESPTHHYPDNFPSGWATPAVACGEVEGIEGINLLRKEILKLMSVFDCAETAIGHDWIKARGREPISWGGQKYSSCYGALFEFFQQVKDVLRWCWLTEEELEELDAKAPTDIDLVDLNVVRNQQAIYERLTKIEGDNDLLDLLVYAEQ
jgi:hypothetical protein